MEEKLSSGSSHADRIFVLVPISQNLTDTRAINQLGEAFFLAHQGVL